MKNAKLNTDQSVLTWCRQKLLKWGKKHQADIALHGIMNYQAHTPEF